MNQNEDKKLKQIAKSEQSLETLADQREMVARAKEPGKVSGPIRLYMTWPLIMTAVLAVLAVWLFFVRPGFGVIMAIATVAYAAVVFPMYGYYRNRVAGELVAFAERYGFARNQFMSEMTTPYGIVLPNGRLLWMNDAFKALAGEKAQPGKALISTFPALAESIFPLPKEERFEKRLEHDGHHYRAEVQKIDASEYNVHYEDGQTQHPEMDVFYGVYLFDETDLVRYVRENAEERLVTCLVYIDNFDEMIEKVEEVQQSLIVASIDRAIAQYFSDIDGISRKLENDKYFVIFKEKYYHQIKNDNFSLLNKIKTIDTEGNVAPTLSLGIGLQGSSYSEDYEYARAAIDMALARGGDQVVVKSGDRTTFFGGMTDQTAPNTRVRARVKAEALRELIMQHNEILIMGHQMADVDCLGAAIGIHRIAKTLDRESRIVFGEVTMSTRPLLAAFRDSGIFDEELLITDDEALSRARERTLLIVVDTNRPERTECPKLLEKCGTIVVLDHHRQVEEQIKTPALSYVEPYASSTCEMVAELMQYISDDLKLRPVEADSLYAGIIIDTNNFLTKTGVRTFEAAAYLRRCGADVIRVRKLFRDDQRSYRAKAEVVSAAEIYRKHYAISVFPTIDIDSPTIIGAQAANELLNINEIHASFVLTEYKGKIYISARSIDEVNVQTIMESMGGGGHMSTAGAQVQHTDMDEAIASLKAVLDEYIDQE